MTKQIAESNVVCLPESISAPRRKLRFCFLCPKGLGPTFQAAKHSRRGPLAAPGVRYRQTDISGRNAECQQMILILPWDTVLSQSCLSKEPCALQRRCWRSQKETPGSIRVR